MDFYVIPPKNNLDLMHLGKGSRYFCLAQLYLSDPNYREFFQSLPPDSWITLDNGAGDHDLVTEDELFKVMHDLKPNEVIPPDVLFNGSLTIENAMTFYERMCEENLNESIEIFFCPQGETRDNWISSYVWALQQDWIKTIGFSKIALPNAFFGVQGDRGIMESRHNAFNYLKVHGLLSKPIHLLGMGDPREFKYYLQFKEGEFIRSSDSCNSVWSSINNQNWYLGHFDRIPTPKDYFEYQVTDEIIPAVKRNVQFLTETVM